MNPLFNGNKVLYCNVCSDYRHAMTKLNTVRMIADQLEEYVKKREHKDVHNQPAVYVYNDCIHTHFMCGSCQMFHKSDMDYAEQKIHDNAYSICCNIRDGLINEREYREIISIIAGYYPITLRTINQIWQKTNKR